MKHSISNTTLFQLVVAFTLIFSAFLALTITYNRIYKIRNESLLILEKYEGKNNSIAIINNFLVSNGYKTKGKCKKGEFGIENLSSTTYSDDLTKDYYYCIKSVVKTTKKKANNKYYRTGKTIKYELKFFYKFNLPIIGDILKFDITGETKRINYYSDEQEFK